MNKERLLKYFLGIFQHPQILFILGAGASVPLVPVFSELSELVLNQAIKIGFYPVEQIPLDPDSPSARIVKSAKQKLQLIDPFNDALAIRAEFAERLSGGAIETITIKKLHPPHPTHCLQYEIFDLLRSSITILNYNNDGLAENFIRRHLVLSMHGTSLSPERRSQLDWDSLPWLLQQSQHSHAPKIPGLLLPQVEPPEIVETLNFQLASKILLNAKYIIIIGYSFGDKDDIKTYEMLKQTVCRTKAPVIFLGPGLEEAVDRLCWEINSRNVAGLPYKWNILAEAIVRTLTLRFHKSCDSRQLCARCVTQAYNALSLMEQNA